MSYAKDKGFRIGIRLTRDQRIAITKIAEVSGKSISDVARSLIDYALKNAENLPNVDRLLEKEDNGNGYATRNL